MKAELRHRGVRDLAWTIGSPPLCRPPDGAFARWIAAHECRAEVEALDDWLRAQDRDPTALREFVNARGTQRLGHYFETLTSFWLAHAPGYERIAEGLVLRSGGETRGELDFVYRHGAQVVHLEVAVKFYLRVAAAPSPRSYVGPSLRDRFDRKLDKLEREQSRRLEQGLGEDAYAALGLRVDAAEVRLKGVLFEPHGEELDPPELVDPSSLRGVWVEVSQLPRLASDGEWHVLDKLEWLSGPEPGRPGMSFDGVVKLLGVRPAPRAVQLCERIGSELRRVFVVPDGFASAATSALD